ncbi:MAG: ATP-binding cassette domain-containing protein [Lachnospiraceae bacterium]|nr:ATP-binding cassette domain-containing protein [Lachnospiraceae bacterium]
MSIINVDHLTKKYGDFTAVDQVSFQVEKGTMLGFLGVNGAGKTTVINMLATLLTPDGGSAVICGETLGKGNARIRRKIGIVYQQNCLDDLLTVRENLLCRGILHGASSKEAAGQCERLSGILKLGDLMNKKYRTLSGGQKRRCEIAAALVHTPQVLFLDEPTTGLDPATRMDVWNTIEALQKSDKMTVFLTTHYMEEAAGAGQIIILDHGRLITSGTPFELKEKFASDKLRLYVKEGQERSLLEQLPSFYRQGKPHKEIRRIEGRVLEVPIPSTMEALPIIQRVQDWIDGFEVILGNMDDVFLNAVGRELREEAEESA